MGKGGSGQTTSTSTTKPPADVTKAYDQISQQAFSAANAPLQQYSGPLLAGFTPQQNQAFQSIQNTQGAANPYYQQANQYIQNSAAPITLPQFSQQALQQYSSPYQQDVINATMAQLGQQNAIDQNSELGTSIAGGAFGGDRAGIAAAQLAKNQGLNNASVLAGLNNQNYSQALGQFNTQQSASLQQQAANAGVNAQAASLSGNLGAQQQQSNLLDQNALLQAGTLQQQQAQSALNIPYQQFEQQQQYPFQTTQFLANTLLGASGSQGSTTTSQQPQPNQASGLIGDAIGIASIPGIWSDERIKEDIKEVGKLNNGLPVYTYKYKGDPTPRMGLIAQDVEKVKPDAVHEINGVKAVDYNRAAHKNGGRTGYAGGGAIPDVSQSYVPTSNPVPVSQSLQPAQFSQPQQQNQGGQMDLLSALAALKKLNSTNGWFPTQAGADAAADKAGILWNQPANQLIPSNPNTPASVNAQAPGTNEYDSIFWNQPASQLPGITAQGYADGGQATPNFDQIQLGNGVSQSMSPIVAGTPVYSFDPKFAASQGTTINPPASTAAPTQNSIGPITDYQKGLISALGNIPTSGPTGPGASGINATGQVSADLFNTILNPTAKHSFDPINKQWVDYNGDPYTGAANGGRIGYDGGGQVTMQNSPPLSLNDLYNQYNPYSGHLGVPSGLSPVSLPNAPDVSQSPVPVSSQPQGQAALNAPSSPISSPQSPQGLAPQTAAAVQAANPNSNTSDFSAPPLSPSEALSTAGFAIAAGQSPYALQNIGAGALEGIKNWQQQKDLQYKAQEAAELLGLKAQLGIGGGGTAYALALKSVQKTHPEWNADDQAIAASSIVKGNGAGLSSTDVGKQALQSEATTENTKEKAKQDAIVADAQQKAANTETGKAQPKTLLNTQDILNKSDLITGNIDNAIGMMKKLEQAHPDIGSSTSWTKLAQQYQQNNPAAKKDIDTSIAGINAYGANNLLLSVKPYLQGTGQVRAFEGQNLAKVFSYDPDVSLSANIQKFQQARQGIIDARQNALKTYQASKTGKLQDANVPPPNLPDGARKAPDGNYYVPDPNRAGKYLMVQ